MNFSSVAYRWSQVSDYPKKVYTEFVHSLKILFSRGSSIRREKSTTNRMKSDSNYSAYTKDLFIEGNCSRTLICVEPQVFVQGNAIQNDLYINLVHSLAENNYFLIDIWKEIVKWSSIDKPEEYQMLLEHLIVENRITHCFFDLNCSRKSSIFDISLLIKLKQKYDLKFVFFAPDFAEKKYLHWNVIADVFVMSRPSKMKDLPTSITKKILLQPGTPYSTQLLKISPKDLDFAFVGSPSRGRKLFLKGISKLPMTSHIEFNGKVDGLIREYRDYVQIISRARMTFSNGYIRSRDNLISGRFIESILMNTLVFYENCPDLEYFFDSSEHFISVENRYELRRGLLQLAKEDELREFITNSARSYYLQNYGSAVVYQKIFDFQR